MYEVEKSVPLPPKPARQVGRPPKYPFHRMDVGDSVALPRTGVSLSDCASYLAAQRYGRRHNKRFEGRIMSADTIRIWRVEDPAPRTTNPPGRRAKYGFDKMKVGDSVELPGTRLSPRSSKAYGAAMRYGSRTGKRFEARRWTDTTIRIWRIE